MRNSYSKRIALYTIARKEVGRILRLWTQTLIPSVVTSILFFVIFGNLIGSYIGEINGIEYLAFIIPGLIMMNVINNSFTNTAYSFFHNKFHKSIEEILVSPTPNWIVVIGFAVGGMFRGLVVGFLIILMSLFFVDLVIFNIIVLVSSVVLTSILFSFAGLINGIYAKKFDDVGIIPLFVLVPLTYFGGVFYSISLLPQFWQTLSLINPILYMVNIFRYGFFGVSDVSIKFAILIIIILLIIFYMWAVYLLNRGYSMQTYNVKK